MVLVHNTQIENVWWKKVTEVALELEFYIEFPSNGGASYMSQWYHAGGKQKQGKGVILV